MDHAMVLITQNGYANNNFLQTTTKVRAGRQMVTKAQTLVVGARAINHNFKKPPLNSNDSSFLYINVTSINVKTVDKINK